MYKRASRFRQSLARRGQAVTSRNLVASDSVARGKSTRSKLAQRLDARVRDVTRAAKAGYARLRRTSSPDCHPWTAPLSIGGNGQLLASFTGDMALCPLQSEITISPRTKSAGIFKCSKFEPLSLSAPLRRRPTGPRNFRRWLGFAARLCGESVSPGLWCGTVAAVAGISPARRLRSRLRQLPGRPPGTRCRQA
jgi:hypothetical protein